MSVLPYCPNFSSTHWAAGRGEKHGRRKEEKGRKRKKKKKKGTKRSTKEAKVQDWRNQDPGTRQSLSRLSVLPTGSAPQMHA